MECGGDLLALYVNRPTFMHDYGTIASTRAESVWGSRHRLGVRSAVEASRADMSAWSYPTMAVSSAIF